MQSLVHRLLHLFFEPERLASHRIFERTKNMKVTGSKVWLVRQVWKTLGQIVMLEQTSVLRHPRMDLTAGCM
jgi:hypothetical protein